jgi:hypothetical protein
MTHLATHNLEPNLLDELALVADPHTPTRKPFADAFEAACRAEADESWGGLIDPSSVRARLLDRPDYNARQLSALWSSSWLVKTGVAVRIRGEGSRGNGNKSTFYRRLRT